MARHIIRRNSVPRFWCQIKCRQDHLRAVGTSPDYNLEMEGLFTQGSRSDRTFSELFGGIIKMDSSDWSKAKAERDSIP